MHNSAFVGLSSNIGDKAYHIQTAIKEIAKFATIQHISSIYLTEPVGFQEQDEFLNGVLQIQTGLSHQDLLKTLKAIEKQLGRVKIIQDGPRIMDLDILYYNDLCFQSPTLTIPHPRLHLRNFVLTPLCEIAPEFMHPILKKTSQALLANLKNPAKVKFYATFN